MRLIDENLFQTPPNITKGELAKLWPLPPDTKEYDTSVPQLWLDETAQKLSDFTGHPLAECYHDLWLTVWVYSDTAPHGEPWPIHPRAVRALATLSFR